MTDEQQNEIARLISEGYTSGRLDGEDGSRVTWSLEITEWNESSPEGAPINDAQLQSIVGKPVEITCECRNGLGGGVLLGVFTGACDSWGKWTFEAETGEPEVTTTYYLFADEVTDIEL